MHGENCSDLVLKISIFDRYGEVLPNFLLSLLGILTWESLFLGFMGGSVSFLVDLMTISDWENFQFWEVLPVFFPAFGNFLDIFDLSSLYVTENNPPYRINGLES